MNTPSNKKNENNKDRSFHQDSKQNVEKEQVCVVFSLHSLMWYLLLSISCAVFILLSVLSLLLANYLVHPPDPYSKRSDFEGFNNETGVRSHIVPNIVHFIRFNQTEFPFMDAICILAAVKNQKPDKLYIHTNVEIFRGKYWDYLLRNKQFSDIYEIKIFEMPAHVFGQKFNKGWLFHHASDIARLEILMKYGGIYLDRDSYIVQSLDRYRHFEIALAWDEDDPLGSQTIIAHRNARFLHEWLESYRDNYNISLWYYNAGEFPTTSILTPRPYLIHRVKLLLGAHSGLGFKVHREKFPEWRLQHAIHLLSNHRSYICPKYDEIKVFDEINILNHNYTIGEMARDVLNWHPF